jgi:pimeloyl-ACP methyl ester carboxylesterase
MTPWKFTELTGRRPPKRLLGTGLGVGLLGGMAMVGLRFFIRPPTKTRIPDTISPAEFQRRAFQSSRGQLVYHESAPRVARLRPTLVFVHDFGVGASSYEWSKVYPAFTGTHRVLAPDLIGFGESERPTRALRAADHTEVLAEFLGDLVGEQDEAAVLVACGGAAGLCARLAVERPELVSRLILLTPSGTSGASWPLALAARLPNLGRYVYRNLTARRGAIRRGLIETAFAEPGSVNAEIIEVHTLCAQQYQAGFAVRAWWAGQLDVALEGCFAALTRPVAVFMSERIPPRERARIERLTGPEATPHVIAGAGPRLAALEVPAGVTAALREELLAQDGAALPGVAAREA